MTRKLAAIIKEISEDYNLGIKRVSVGRVEIERYHTAHGTHHAIMTYRVPKAGKVIWMDYDIDRGLARDVMVY